MALPFMLLGVALALIEIVGWLPDGNRAWLVSLWAIAAFPVAWMVSRSGRFVLGFTTGFLMVAAAHLLTVLLWRWYADENPAYVLQWSEGAARLDLTVRGYELAALLPVGLLYGIAIGALAWIIAAVRRGRSEELV